MAWWLVLGIALGLLPLIFRGRKRGGTAVVPNVTCIVRDAKTKEELYRVKAHNLLVDTGRKHFRDMWGGTGLRPDKIAIGSGTTAPVAGDTALGTQTLSKLIDRRVQQAFGVDFQTLIETGEANGTEIAEIGTLRGVKLISRAVLSAPISKTAGIEVTISHVHTVNAS